MNLFQLIYELNEFYFTSIWHFIGMLIMVLAIRGEILKGATKIKEYYRIVVQKYKKIRLRDSLMEKAKNQVPNDLKKYPHIKLDDKK